MNSTDSICVHSKVYYPPMLSNGTGACTALHTEQTLALLDACCPTPIYALNSTSTTNGTTSCGYIACDISSYDLWAEAASCVGSSVIIEDHDAAEADTEVVVKGCEFNYNGELYEISNAAPGRRRGGGRLWVLAWVVMGVGLVGMG